MRKTALYLMIATATFTAKAQQQKAFEPEMVSVQGNGKVHSFNIGKYEVTQGQWKAVMGDNPSSYKIGDNYPVTNVSWYDVQKFIKKLNALTGKKYRLPTEAEWTYAAKGGNKSKGYAYSGSNNIEDVAWYSGNSSNSVLRPVGKKAPNELGIYDMSGNVWEWCQDNEDTNRVFRGGSWKEDALYCSVEHRNYNSPKSIYYNLGFRLVLPEGNGSPSVLTISVSNVKEFITALGSDRIIELKPGKYRLIDGLGAPLIPEKVWWTSNEGGLALSGFSNLTIRSAKSRKFAELIINDPYAYVLSFVNCNNIVIEGIKAGHSVKGYCEGGVFGFWNSTGITINQTAMYGCGAEGLLFRDVEDVTVTNSSIYECSYQIMTVYECRNISFENCIFHNNKEYDLVQIYRVQNLSFADCTFKDNRGFKMFKALESKVAVLRSLFIGNHTERGESIENNSPNVSFFDCTFKNNAEDHDRFKKYK